MQTVEYVIYFFFGLLEVLLTFRLVLKLMGARVASGFVGFVYGITSLFLYPFAGIFHRAFAQGIDAVSVFEPETLIALIVYAAVAWGVVRLLQILSREQQVA